MSQSNDPFSGNPPRLRQALAEVRPLLHEMPDSALLPINIEPLSAVTKVRGALPALLALRDSIVSEIRSFDPTNLDQLETYALAFIQAETIHRGISARSRLLSQLSLEATVLRIRLLNDSNVLVSRGLIQQERLSRLTGRKGHRNLASDLLTLSELLRDSWSTIANSTAITLAELDRAEVLGDEMINALGRRTEVTADAAEAALQRRRAYSLLIRAYDEVRNAVLYLRRHDGDADQIAPSLHEKRTLRRRKARRDDASSTSSTGDSHLSPTAEPVADTRPRTEQEQTNGNDSKAGQPGFDPFLH